MSNVIEFKPRWLLGSKRIDPAELLPTSKSGKSGFGQTPLQLNLSAALSELRELLSAFGATSTDTLDSDGNFVRIEFRKPE